MPEGGGPLVRIHRGFLGWGVFFIVFGLVPLAVRLGWVSGANLSSAWQLWPLFLVGAGVGLVLRKTPFEPVGGLIVAATGGLMLGSVLAVGPSIGVACAPASSQATVASESGTLGPGAAIALQATCARATASAGPGETWTVAWGPAGDDRPAIDASTSRLSVTGPSGPGKIVIPGAGAAWDVTVPAAVTRRLTAEVDAGSVDMPLDGLTLDAATVRVNAGGMRADFGGSSVARLDGEVNLGTLRVGLPAGGGTDGRLSANLATVVLCAPEGLPLRVYTSGGLASFDLPGMTKSGEMYQTAGFPASGGATLRVEANLGSVRLEWGGTCR
jgi:hypothetical protein